MANVHDRRTYLGESRALGNLLHTLDERAQVDRCHVRVANKLHEVVNDNHGATLNLHAPVIEGAQEQRDEDSEGGGGDLRDERRVRE